MDNNALLDVIEFARYQILDWVTGADYPYDDMVEALARCTDALRQSGRELPSDIGRRVVMKDGQKGIITSVLTWEEPTTYTVFVDGAENFWFMEKDFTWEDDDD